MGFWLVGVLFCFECYKVFKEPCSVTQNSLHLEIHNSRKKTVGTTSALTEKTISTVTCDFIHLYWQNKLEKM